MEYSLTFIIEKFKSLKLFKLLNMMMSDKLQRIFLVDPEKCTGCRFCELICSLTKTGECNPQKARIRVISIPHKGIDVPIVCQHCEDAPCRAVCPVDALRRDPKTGAIVLNPLICIGCKACIMACPYGAITIDVETRQIMKCDLCDGEPRCVKYCVTQAIQFVRADVAAKIKRKRVIEKMEEPLLEARKTQLIGGS
jgi:Fe-S-cluster-containing hydrogenase component 2